MWEYKMKRIDEMTDKELQDYREQLDTEILYYMYSDDLEDDDALALFTDAKLEELAVLIEQEERSNK
tara:strand:+ start:353 stop:553 length:201 start_codon:yes stop_codon:yes gene_type:complete